MITINIEKAKSIAHEKRRNARAEEFKPYDEVIMKQIPGVNLAQVEASRQEIRTRYAGMQAAIDTAATVDEIKAVMPQEAN